METQKQSDTIKDILEEIQKKSITFEDPDFKYQPKGQKYLEIRV